MKAQIQYKVIKCLVIMFSSSGYRQSYSGSETSTDLSLSSTENLSTFTRQDPQGEETTGGVTTPSLEPWDTSTADPSYGLVPQLANVPTSGVEIRSTNSATFYVMGNRPTSTSPNQELVHWNGEMTAPPGGCYVNNVMPGQMTTGTKIMYPSAPAVYSTSKMAPPAGARPQSAHGVPSLQRREELHVIQRPASVNANPLPGVYLPENSPPRPNFMPNLTNMQQGKPVVMTTTAAAIIASTQNNAGYPPPPTYPGIGHTQKAKNHVSANGNAKNNASTVTKTVNSHQRPTVSVNASPSTNATCRPTAGNNISPTANANSMTEQVLKPMEKQRLREKEELRRSYEMLERAQLTRSHPDLTHLPDINGPKLLSIPSPVCGSKPPGTRTPSPQPTFIKHGQPQR